jgi:hypothetical protein
MLGQLCVEPELELLEPEPDELDDGVVVEELVLALEPVVPVLEELVVAASATSAPPVTRPVVSAPIANTFRIRIFMVAVLSLRVKRRSVRSGRHTLRPGPVASRTTTATCRLGFLTIG